MGTTTAHQKMAAELGKLRHDHMKDEKKEGGSFSVGERRC